MVEEGCKEGNVQMAAVRMMRRAQWFLISLPIFLEVVRWWIEVVVDVDVVEMA